MIGLEPLETLIDLPLGDFAGAPVNLCHQESPGAIPVPKCLSHPYLALSFVIIPAVIQEIDPLIEGRSHDSNALRLRGLGSDVKSTEPDDGYLFARPSHGTPGHFAHGGGPFALRLRSHEAGSHTDGNGRGGGAAQELTTGD